MGVKVRVARPTVASKTHICTRLDECANVASAALESGFRAGACCTASLLLSSPLAPIKAPLIIEPPPPHPPPPPSLLIVVNNRNGVISAAPRETAPQL